MASIGSAPGADPLRPSANAAAKKCLEDLYEKLEVTIKKRLRIKLGGVQTVDWSKLSIALNSAQPKPKPPILPSSRTWRTDLAVEMKPEIKQQLREVFIKYCGWGDKQNFMFISRSQFIRFARDMGMCNEEIDALGLSGLFDKILLGSLDPGAASRLAMSDFVLAVTGLGTKLCPAPTVQESFETVVKRYVLPRLGQALPEPDAIDSALLHLDVMGTLERLRPKLVVLWETYMQQQQLQHHNSGTASGHDYSMGGGDQRMSLSTFLRFAADFEITVVLLSKVQLIHSFKRSKFGAHEEPIDSNPHTRIKLNFQEWLDCLARCALLAYDYKPPPVIVPTLDFKACYHTNAKQMWLAEAVAGHHTGRGGLLGDDDELDEASELEMPAAVDYALGNEDRPHYDEIMSHAPSIRITRSAGAGAGPGPRSPGAASVYGRDRLISRAVSIAQGRTRTQEPGGAEAMLIHPEPSTMQQDPNKPVHLQSFTCDWVGKPGLTLSETGRLRQRSPDPFIAAGLYHTQVGVDPAYAARAAEMEAARLVREQHVEALKLNYQAERRQEIRDTTKAAAARRQDLELTSGQVLARVMGSLGASSSSMGGSGGGSGRARSERRSVSPQEQDAAAAAVAVTGAVGRRQGSGGGRRGGPPQSMRSGSAPRLGGGAGTGGAGAGSGTMVPGLEEVMARTGGRSALHAAAATGGASPAKHSRTLLQELQQALDVESKLPQHATTIAGHGQIRFG
ncbi:hypothetical protein HYH02_003948 [Chlamydomonas schloesseri]|uniref:Uncharacterized protein n=1 Tax=Chlamydomonas schloesseri TaxID=2026947 RepID=A0A836B9M6_9CHLO|nr:hypothetical protein HYH02_003948 [Chlamydomonas schloesseri]|eukprot:KAG2451344.1 hypothetical protein HYH02_003948 [Chlamydomonas schloesseri]